jgi:hypothetical protein
MKKAKLPHKVSPADLKKMSPRKAMATNNKSSLAGKNNVKGK